MFAALSIQNRMLARDLEIYLKDIRQGNQLAFEKVFKALYADLCRYANSLLHDPDEAEDLVQNTFVILWEKRQHIVIESSLKAYLYKAVYNHCLNKVKHLQVRQQHREYTLNHSDELASGLPLGLHELQTQIERALQKLPEQCGKIFNMSRYDELKYQEIADILGISIKTVENQMGKALKIMREELSDYLVSIIIFLNIIL